MYLYVYVFVHIGVIYIHILYTCVFRKRIYMSTRISIQIHTHISRYCDKHTCIHVYLPHCNRRENPIENGNTLQHTTTHRNTLQHTATHCNTMQHNATHCNTLQHTATHCNTHIYRKCQRGENALQNSRK